MAKKKSSFWTDFKKFISKGNVVDMAVGVVLGGAFGKIVTGLVNFIINPFVGIFLKDGDLASIKTVLIKEVVDEAGEITTPEVALQWGNWIQTILDFLIVAMCIFLVLRILMHVKNTVNEKEILEAERKAEEEKQKAEAEKQAAAQAEAARAKLQAELEAATLHQEQLLIEIRDLLKKQ